MSEPETADGDASPEPAPADGVDTAEQPSASLPPRGRDRSWLLGFLGLLGLVGVEAFSQDDPLLLFWFVFFGLFVHFGAVRRELRYLGLLGLGGFLLALLGLAGLLPL
jgi:hypothetical protein